LREDLRGGVVHLGGHGHIDALPRHRACSRARFEIDHMHDGAIGQELLDDGQGRCRSIQTARRSIDVQLL
jgi:hypothetical protein